MQLRMSCRLISSAVGFPYNVSVAFIFVRPVHFVISLYKSKTKEAFDLSFLHSLFSNCGAPTSSFVIFMCINHCPPYLFLLLPSFFCLFFRIYMSVSSVPTLLKPLLGRYEACMDVTDSDHKPVRCIFNVEIARVDESVRRQEYGEIIRSNEKVVLMLQELNRIPEAIISTNNIILLNSDASILRLTNKCGKNKVIFEIFCEGESTVKDDGQVFDYHPRGSFGFPRWLEVTSTS